MFKYPGDLREAILDHPPHVLGCSNYPWNTNLSYYFCQWAKSINHNILTVCGGPTYPFDAARQEEIMKSHQDIDIRILLEGEDAFCKIIERILSVSNYAQILDDPIPGCHFINHKDDQFMRGPLLPRIRELDTIPSPYTTGILDKFFDGYLYPLVETIRGCPFTCNYCNHAHAYFSKVNLFSIDYIHDELTYIAKRASKVGVTYLMLTDSNFGMIPRDTNIADFIYHLRKEYGWPQSIAVALGKNNKKRVIDATKILSDMMSIDMSVQSMSDVVLKNIGRENIKFDYYRTIVSELSAQGRNTKADMIIPLPGETMESYIKGLNDLLDANIGVVTTHTLQMNYGTPYKDDENFRKTHGYVTKYRIVTMDFSRIDDKYIFDVEEVAVASKTFSFSEYMEARKYLLVIDLCCNSGVFNPLRKYLISRNFKNSEWLWHIYRKINACLPESKQIFDSFEKETISELWEVEDELISFYSRPENYEKLLNYERGGNVLFKHRNLMLIKADQQWVETVFRCTEELILNKIGSVDGSMLRHELDTLKEYILCLVVDCLSPERFDKPLEKTLEYDIPAWLQESNSVLLSNFAAHKPITLRFYLSSNNIAVMRDAFKRYGTDIAGLTKMTQRVESMYYRRNVKAV